MVATVAAAVLGVALLVAGGAKRAAPSWPAQAAALGAPRWSIPLVPWIELVLGGLLVAQVARPIVAVAAGGVLLVFTGLLVNRLRQGERPPCACFGRWSAGPIGWWSVARNGAMIALALVAALG